MFLVSKIIILFYFKKSMFSVLVVKSVNLELQLS